MRRIFLLKTCHFLTYGGSRREEGFFDTEKKNLDSAAVITDVVTMTIETKVRKIGNSLGIVLPKEALQAMRVEEGSTVYLTEAPNSSMAITTNLEGFKKKMDIAESLMQRYRNAFQELAK